ncbi:MAG: 50S ribosomal protein L21 [Halobacteriovorax sp.]|nr:50S ribosomal protein L21 [Halobacteriovorax sp.]|tara:strand:+ start:77625 stop:77975 length:351 start_codon:yes stop_codon:yes gene_type:complete
MYAVVEIGGHQYKVKAGDLIDVQKLEGEAGSTVELDKVLFVGGDKPEVGLPHVSGAKVTAKLIKHDKSRKQLVFVRKPGMYRRKNGHRQQYTALLITDVNGTKIDPKSKNAEKYLK